MCLLLTWAVEKRKKKKKKITPECGVRSCFYKQILQDDLYCRCAVWDKEGRKTCFPPSLFSLPFLFKLRSVFIKRQCLFQPSPTPKPRLSQHPGDLLLLRMGEQLPFSASVIKTGILVQVRCPERAVCECRRQEHPTGIWRPTPETEKRSLSCRQDRTCRSLSKMRHSPTS